MHLDARISAPPRPTLMLDHPGWQISPTGSTRRSFRSGETTWTVIYESHNNGSAPRITLDTPDDAPADELHLKEASFDPATLPSLLQDAHPFRSAVPLHRIPNPDLWDALLYPILRHRVRESDATRMYRKLCETHGTSVDTKAGSTHLVPRPEVVLTLTNDELIALGMRSRANSLRTAAHAYLTHADGWRSLSAVELFADLQTRPTHRSVDSRRRRRRRHQRLQLLLVLRRTGLHPMAGTLHRPEYRPARTPLQGHLDQTRPQPTLDPGCPTARVEASHRQDVAGERSTQRTAAQHWSA